MLLNINKSRNSKHFKFKKILLETEFNSFAKLISTCKNTNISTCKNTNISTRKNTNISTCKNTNISN